MESRTWGWSSDAREKADQARREDDEYWSGPTYYHGAYERHAWGAARDPEQKNEYNSKHQEGQRAARKEARREAERDKRYDDGSWKKSPSPQQPDPDWSERVKEKKEEKEQSARRKAERELSQRNWPVELLLLFSNIIALQVDIERTQVKVDASRRAMKVRIPQSVSLLFENDETCLGATERASALSRFQNMVEQRYLVSQHELPLPSLMIPFCLFICDSLVIDLLKLKPSLG